MSKLPPQKASDRTLREFLRNWLEEDCYPELNKETEEKLCRKSGIHDVAASLVWERAKELHQIMYYSGFAGRFFKPEYFAINGVDVRFRIDESRFVVLRYDQGSHTMRAQLSRVGKFKTVRTLPNGFSYCGREHARVDVEELSLYPVKELSNFSELSPSAIRAARRCGGHVRAKSKEALEEAMEYLREVGEYNYTLRSALKLGKISQAEYDAVVIAIKNEGWLTGDEIGFKNFSWTFCEETLAYNEAAAAVAKVKKFFKGKRL